jgi:hypothetical protein
VIQPKDLYRKLAALLANIDEGRTKDDFLFLEKLIVQHQEKSAQKRFWR